MHGTTVKIYESCLPVAMRPTYTGEERKRTPPPGHVLVFVLQMGLEPTIPMFELQKTRLETRCHSDLTYSQSLYIRPTHLVEQHTRLTGYAAGNLHE